MDVGHSTTPRVEIIKSISELDNSVVSFNHGNVETIPPVAFEEVKSFSDGMYTETEDEGFMAGPNNRSILEREGAVGHVGHVRGGGADHGGLGFSSIWVQSVPKQKCL